MVTLVKQMKQLKEPEQKISPFEPMRPNSLDQFFDRPDWYDPPRQIQLGLQITW